MRVSEVSKLLTKELGSYINDSFVRFYGNKIVGYNRTRGNRYRDITEEDIKKLKKIYALTKLGVSLPVIRDHIQEDTKEAYDAIVERKMELSKLLEGGLLHEFC